MLKHANVTLQVLKNNQFSWTPPRALAHKILPSRSLNKSKAALLKSRVEILLICPAPSTQDPEFNHSMVTAVKAASDLHLSHVCRYEFQQEHPPLSAP